MSEVNLMQGDCLDKLKELEDNSVDSIVTDPPYGLSFMGKAWDKAVPSVEVWEECLRVLKPGGHLLSFAGTRTQHRMAVNIEDAGFEIRDMVAWVYGSGFPKSQNVSKAIDKAAGARGHDGVGFNVAGKSSGLGVTECKELRSDHPDYVKPVGITDAAKQWDGWGTALKPALEPITVARKPLTGTVAANVMEYGTGAINIDGSRIPANGEKTGSNGAVGFSPEKGWNSHNMPSNVNKEQSTEQGRFPANLIHDGSDEVVELFPVTGSGNNKGAYSYSGVEYDNKDTSMFNGDKPQSPSNYNDNGSAARFFYCPKANKKDRNEGLTQDQANKHPTVKPTDLMRYLCRLVTPPGGTVLDPFMGSGSTGKATRQEGFHFIGIELDSDYFSIAESRIKDADPGNTLEDYLK